MQAQTSVSIVIPVFNEERNVAPLFSALAKACKPLDVACEFIFVDDGSTDGSLAAIEQLAKGDPRVRFIALSRNFGKEVATTAGVHAATGDACVMIDADLQHPPELLPEFISRWRAGAEVVVGVRTANPDESRLRRFCSATYYRLINALSETRMVPNATDYRLIDRAVIHEFNRFTERRRMTRALIDWLGFRRDYVTFVAPARVRGTSNYGTMRMLRLAAGSFISHSLFPLKLAGYLGAFITMTSGALGAFILVEKYILHDPLELHFSGPAILAVIILFLVGIVLCCLGLIALYIANIHGEVLNRPLYAVRKRSRD